MSQTIESALEKVLGLAGIRSHFVETEQGSQHYYELKGEGTLPTMVLIHGIGASASSYAPIMQRLRKSAKRIIALDLPGHGLSEPLRQGRGHRGVFDTGCETLSGLLSEPSIVFGNSMGGAFVLNFASRYPQLVAGLILCSPAGTPMKAADLKHFVSHFNLDSYYKAYQFAQRIYARTPWYTFMLLPFLRHIFASQTMRDILEDIRPEDGISREELHNLTMPILLLWGKCDRLMPPEHLRYYRENLPPQSQIEEPIDFGHCPQMEKPDALSEKILLFTKMALNITS